MARILVVDDESNIRMMVRFALQHVGHRVECAADGPEGLEKFGDGKTWDLVLLDHRMPAMEGIEVLYRLKHRDPEARVIMITAFGTMDLAVEALKAGARDFLRKPFTAETLRGAVQSALRDKGPEVTQAGGNVRLALSTINGYWIESSRGAFVRSEGSIRHTFTLRSPANESCECDVLLPSYFVELVKIHADRDEMPGGDRFWQALSEEVVANYVWQHSEFPPGGLIQVEDLTASLSRWIDSVLTAGQENADGKSPV